MSIFKRRLFSAPLELYLFRTGSAEDARIAYTNTDRSITWDGVEYLPIPIKRGKIATQGNLDKSDLDLEMPTSSDLAELFRVGAPSFPVSLTIFQGDHGDTSGYFHRAIWTGRVMQVTRDLDGDMDVAKVSCRPWSQALKMGGLRRNYQLGCPHVLYGDQCMADKAAATVTLEATSANGLRIGLGADWHGMYQPSDYRNGLVEWEGSRGTERRTITSTDGTGVNVRSGVTDLAAGDTVKVSLGCNHSLYQCDFLHSNIKNFGGQPWIPLENPVNRSQS